jgi:hypothetical protein
MAAACGRCRCSRKSALEPRATGLRAVPALLPVSPCQTTRRIPPQNVQGTIAHFPHRGKDIMRTPSSRLFVAPGSLSAWIWAGLELALGATTQALAAVAEAATRQKGMMMSGDGLDRSLIVPAKRRPSRLQGHCGWARNDTDGQRLRDAGFIIADDRIYISGISHV